MNFWQFHSLQISINDVRMSEKKENAKRSGKIMFGQPSPSQKKAIERRKERRLKEGIKSG